MTFIRFSFEKIFYSFVEIVRDIYNLYLQTFKEFGTDPQFALEMFFNVFFFQISRLFLGLSNHGKALEKF
jgi:hypothetical protein